MSRYHKAKNQLKNLVFLDNVRFPEGNLFFIFSLAASDISCNKGLFH
ncbi:hypothetical protein BSBH6_03419 [Bacillus subtilis]|nr:hypothetical protein BSBH6_03419 [Bacillus subtilis]RPK22613.1 hypothetical protein BH5_03425 [Bacillus subtilis]